MIRAFTLVMLLLAPQMALSVQPLRPPDVTFFFAADATRTDFSNLGIDTDASGFRLRGGLWLEDVHYGRWQLGLELAYSRFGDPGTDHRLRREPTTSEILLNGNLSHVIETTTRTRGLSGLELGVRLYDSELFYIRGGAFLYHYRKEVDIQKTLIEIDGDRITRKTRSDSKTMSTLGPYIGAGFSFPLFGDLRLTTGISAYWVESESLTTLSMGLQYQWGND